jgi:hypothetical protein
METKLVIVADLGLLRAYREVPSTRNKEVHLTLIKEFQHDAAHQKLSDQVTDQAGRFPRGRGAGIVTGDLSAGEQLSLKNEQSRRLVKQLAEEINTLLQDEDVGACSLAVSAPIHRQLLEVLDPKARTKIGQVVTSNLVRTDPQALPGYFAKPA